MGLEVQNNSHANKCNKSTHMYSHFNCHRLLIVYLLKGHSSLASLKPGFVKWEDNILMIY